MYRNGALIGIMQIRGFLRPLVIMGLRPLVIEVLRPLVIMVLRPLVIMVLRHQEVVHQLEITV